MRYIVIKALQTSYWLQYTNSHVTHTPYMTIFIKASTQCRLYWDQQWNSTVGWDLDFTTVVFKK